MFGLFKRKRKRLESLATHERYPEIPWMHRPLVLTESQVKSHVINGWTVQYLSPIHYVR